MRDEYYESLKLRAQVSLTVLRRLVKKVPGGNRQYSTFLSFLQRKLKLLLYITQGRSALTLPV